MTTPWAVVLARGASRRMGRPKGLCRLPGDSLNLLERVLALYSGFGLPTAVVATEGLVEIYRDALGDAAPDLWISEPAGDGTARTALAAVNALAGRADRLWLHPVDLPRVRPGTLMALREAVTASPEAVIVPRWRSRRGHPVLIPTAPWVGREPAAATGPMRDLIAGSGLPVVFLETEDPGVVTDMDTPADLEREPGDPGVG